jgi:monolysocardiolipin acyltransferase
MDDPLVMAALLPPSILIQAKNLRWTLCATDRCFTNAAFSAFFRSVKVLPLRRGAGLQQEVTTSTSWKNAIAIQNRVSQVT